MQDTEREYLTSKEAARILKVTPATVMNMIKRGQLRGKKVGTGGISSPWRIPKEEIRWWPAKIGRIVDFLV